MFLEVNTLITSATASTEVTVYNKHEMTTMSQRQPTRERRCILLFLKQNSDGFTTENKHFIQHKPV